ncbi:MAG: sigma-70 family RNA polymerase sigma factor [Planctomycetota bacterium]
MDTPIEHDDFLRLLLQSEREIVRYVMVLIPNAADAQEVFQETAVALWNQIDKYDSSLPFTPWACRFAANKAKEYLRKKGRWSGFLDQDVASLLIARREEVAPELDRRVEPLRDCLAELPSPARTLVQQYYLDQTPIDEIAGRVGRSVAALYKSLQRTRSTLLACVEGKLATTETLR